MPAQVVLVTGVSGRLGGNLAARLAAEPGIRRVVAVDAAPPSWRLRAHLDGVEVLRVDLRSPLVAKVIVEVGADTVVHASLTAGVRHATGGVTHREANVVGTMRLLAACRRAPNLGKFVVKSTTAVYGAGPRDPGVCTEDMAVLGPLAGLVRAAGLVDCGPEQLRYPDFGRVVDTGKLRARTGFTPRWSTAAAFDDYVYGRGRGPATDPEACTASRRRWCGAAGSGACAPAREGDGT